MIPFAGMSGSNFFSQPYNASFFTRPQSSFGLGADLSGSAAPSLFNPGSFLGKAALGMSVGGMVGGIGSSMINASLQKDFLNYQSSIANINANIAEMRAQGAIEQGRQKAQQYMMNVSKIRGAQNVAIGSSGIDFGSDLVKDVRESTSMIADMDIDTIESNAALQAFGYRSEAVNQRVQSMFSQTTAQGISPLASGFSTLLSSGATVADRWYMLNRMGVLG